MSGASLYADAKVVQMIAYQDVRPEAHVAAMRASLENLAAFVEAKGRMSGACGEVRRCP